MKTQLYYVQVKLLMKLISENICLCNSI